MQLLVNRSCGAEPSRFRQVIEKVLPKYFSFQTCFEDDWGINRQISSMIHFKRAAVYSTLRVLDTNFGMGKCWPWVQAPSLAKSWVWWHRCSPDFRLGGGQNTSHMQWRHQKLRKRNFLLGQRYRRMEDQKPWPGVGTKLGTSSRRGFKLIVKIRQCTFWSLLVFNAISKLPFSNVLFSTQTKLEDVFE